MISEDLDPLSILQRSKLYHLEPIAIGTPYVEGLISYICRLAEAHCVSPGILLKKEIMPAFRKNYTTSFGGAYAVQADENGVSVSSVAKPVYRKNLNEYGLLSWQYLEGLKPLTLRKDLQALVIPAEVNKILAKMAGQESGRDLRAWCPECFQDWLTAEYPLYEPLLWSIRLVTVCPIHHLPLQLHCPHCQKAQRPFTNRMAVARCSQCTGWLNVRTETNSEIKFSITMQLEQHLEMAEKVMKLMNLVSHT